LTEEEQNKIMETVITLFSVGLNDQDDFWSV